MNRVDRRPAYPPRPTPQPPRAQSHREQDHKWQVIMRGKTMLLICRICGKREER